MQNSKGFGRLMLALELMNHGFTPGKASEAAIRFSNETVRHEPTVRETVAADQAARRAARRANRRKVA
jgi:hypothetical protein